MTVLVDDLGVHEGDRAGPGPPAIMDNLGNRAYTTALLRGHPFSIVDWPLHETRMERWEPVLWYVLWITNIACSVRWEIKDFESKPLTSNVSDPCK